MADGGPVRFRLPILLGSLLMIVAGFLPWWRAGGGSVSGVPVPAARRSRVAPHPGQDPGDFMPLSPDKLLSLNIPDVEHTYGPRDCILYALGVGLGQDPVNEDELAFVYEQNLKVLPTFAVVMGYNAYVLRRPELGITWSHVVHGEHSVALHRPIAPEGTVIGRSRILDVVDKGEGRGALIYSERKIIDKPTGDELATINQTTFCRADGGFGGPKRETPPPHALPARAPDAVVDL